MSDALTGPVGEFVDAVAAALTDIAPQHPASTLRADVVVEAYELVCALIDSDGLHTDEELWALIGAFAGQMDTQLHRATPADIRAAGLLAGKRVWIEHPSLLFDTLVRADRSAGTRHALTYYVNAMRLAHHTAALDTVTQHAELQALERFRTCLLGTLREAAVAGPLTGDPAAATGVRAPRGHGRPDREPAAEQAGGSGPGGGRVDVRGEPVAGEEPQPPSPPRPLEELLAELDALVGLEPVKAEVRLATDLLQVQALRARRGLKVPQSSHHMVFTGNPGTGKTTVARLLAQIYRTLGLVGAGHLVEADRSHLVAGFVGQTAAKVTEVFDRATGGVLLIDEAYSLLRGGDKDFGMEAIDTIVKLVEDRRDQIVVIVAGYPDEMAAFVHANPGLRSRFPRTIHFPDYSTDDLVRIFELIAAGAEYELAAQARDKLAAVLDAVPRVRGFGNGRLSRNLFERAVARQASRVVVIDHPSDADLRTLLADDVPDTVPAS